MSASALINSLEFARDSGRWAETVSWQALPRLADLLVDTSGVLQCQLQGWRDGSEYGLDLSVTGVARVECQRCLMPMEVPLTLHRCLLLAVAGKPWPDEALADDSFDVIEARRQQSVLELIEDEILLALPIAPRHEECQPAVQLAAAEAKGTSPFAALAGFKWSNTLNKE